jgi:hypothetical protein
MGGHQPPRVLGVVANVGKILGRRSVQRNKQPHRLRRRPWRGDRLRAQPGIRPLLERNIRANGWESRITVVPKGASDASGTARMTIPEDTTAAKVDHEGKGPTIELTTID